MIKAIVVALLAISATRQACDVGCLKCNASGDCLIPDILNSYYLNGTTATKVSLTNCTLNSFDGKCVSCSSGYYLDAATNKCVAVATSGLITNCASYSSATSCSSCNSTYYLSNNACVAVESRISNCDIYSGASVCATCASGYLLSLDNKSCVTAPTISNCGNFTFVKCNTCDSGYVLNPNNYLAVSLVSVSTSDKTALASFAFSISNGKSQSVAQNACQVQSTTNCALFDQGTNTCTQCSSGYYLEATTAKCIVFPDEPIENCLNYSAVNVCSECIAGYYFKSGVCTQITGTDLVANCATYDGKLSTIQCLTCNNNFYLSTTSCVARNVSADNKIANCATKDPKADKCAACATGFVLASDGGQCFTAISNCAVYTATSTGLVLKCSICNSTFFLTNPDTTGANTCQPGSIENCSSYPTGSGTTCLTCVNKFRLLGNACTAHNNIANCVTYNGTQLNFCQVCTKPGFLNFSLNKFCQNLTTGTIANCATYSGDLSAPTCVSCNATFYLNGGACQPVGISSCLSLGADSNCNKCASGYYLATDAKSCILNKPGYVTENCLTNNTEKAAGNSDMIGATSCSVCATGSVPFNLKGYYGCITANEATQINATAVLVDNCIKYDNALKCIQCNPSNTANPKPFLDYPNNACLATCGSGVVRYAVKNFNADATNSSYNVETFNLCATGVITTAVDNCAMYAPSIGDQLDTDYICIKCADTFIDVVALNETQYSNVDPLATNISSYFPSAFAKYPQVSCKAKTATNINGGTNFVANCSYYQQLTVNTSYTCYRCNLGYTGTLDINGRIITCDQDTACASDRYYNLDARINFLTSCHKCTATDNIPFLHINTSNVNNPIFTGFKPYLTAISGGTFTSGAVNTNKNVACRNYTNATFNIAANKYVIDANCGIAVINVNGNGEFTEATSFGNYCAACKPGFVGTPLTTPNATYPYVYKGCVAINNCPTNGTYFNGCSACSTNYILKYDAANSNIDFKTCLLLPTTTPSRFDNCMAATNVGATTNASECRVCKTGYFLNDDKICDKYDTASCATGNFTPIQTTSNVNSLDWSLWLNSNSVGCSQCSGSLIAYNFTATKPTCVKSDWVSKSVDALTTTNYIPNCKNYNVLTTGNLRNCNTCNTNYVPSGSVTGGVVVRDNAACYVNTAIPNCAVASSATVCIECKDATFSLKSGKCELGNIANCVAYNYNNNLTVVNCVTCAADYYLNTANNTSCVMGEIYNCKVLANNSSKTCTTCADGFVKIGGILNSYDYCYPKDSSLGCNDVTIVNDTDNSGGKITCNSCTTPATQVPGSPAATANNTICMAHAPVINCKSFNIGTNLSSSNFLCNECNAGFYLNSNNRCVARVSQPAKCSLYTVTDDTCSKCDNTSYLSATKKECVDYPKGILGCRTYSNATTCTACKDGRYLSNNACPRVTTAITNCFYYSSNTTCSTCSATYALINNACVKATANNCATYTSDTVCATCPAGFVLQTTNSITSCVALTKTGCSVINITSPYECTTCAGSYYLDSGECKVPTAISNCAAYATMTTCSRCNKGFALTVNKDACINSVPTVSFVDSQCIDSQVVSTPVCSRCSAGFYFITGACTGTCNTGSASGCLACDPKTATTCFVCKSGYYQSKDGICNPNNPATANAMIMGIITAIIALFSLNL